jgi:hypothetical protein
MKEESRPLTAGAVTGPPGRVEIEAVQLKRKAMYWLFWVVLVGGLLFSLTHTTLS